MVERRITDGRRIAELLASELDGRTDGALAHLAVTDANRDVEPTSEGSRAYDVRRTVGETDTADDRVETARDDAPVEPARDRLLAQVFVHDEGATVVVETARETAREAATARDLPVDADPSRFDGIAVTVPTGAATKRAADVLAAVARVATEYDRD
ncbi:hypothetical protein OB905_01640 [Halobacteria archaeon AArc-dxtr1]|nr:hypothetical protein [Halobacteria archaeon AArc-dxtr1]